MTLTLRYMQYADIPQVVTIDREAFETPWSARSYAYEVGESSYSHMVVLERSDPRPVNGWRKLVRSFNGGGASDTQREVISYGGLWRIMEEAHISTIATRSDQRGQGFGEVVLVGMMQRAISLGAEYIVLEVRVSNRVAQNLYKKYEFYIADTKPRYYRDNNEDAYDMRLSLEDRAMLARFQQRIETLRQKIAYHDHYTTVDRPTAAG